MRKRVWHLYITLQKEASSTLGDVVFNLLLSEEECRDTFSILMVYAIVCSAFALCLDRVHGSTLHCSCLLPPNLCLPVLIPVNPFFCPSFAKVWNPVASYRPSHGIYLQTNRGC